MQCRALGYILEDHANSTRRKWQYHSVPDEIAEFSQNFISNLRDLYFVTEAIQCAEKMTGFSPGFALANRIGRGQGVKILESGTSMMHPLYQEIECLWFVIF